MPKTLCVRILEKTKKRGGSTLESVIKRYRNDVVCPNLVHEKPKRYRKSTEKEHHYQLSKKQISDSFTTARDKPGFYDELPAGEHAIFNELIALGQHLMNESGRSTRFIQKLRGHTKETTIILYLEDHEQWTTIGLKIS